MNNVLAKYKISAFLLISLIGISGCTEIIDMDLRTGKEQLVVDGILSNEFKINYIYLTKSAPYFMNKPAIPVEGARVKIKYDNVDFYFRESLEFPGFYLADPGRFLPKPGVEYELEVNKVDLEDNEDNISYTATALMPSVVKIDSISLTLQKDYEFWQMMVWFQDPGEEELYYLFRVRQGNYYITNKVRDWTVTSNHLFKGKYVNGLWIQNLNASDNQARFNDGDIIVLEMANISKTFYDFINAMQREERASNSTFGSPPSNIPGNINNNALGIFTAIAVDTMSLVFDSAIHNQ